jgi:hypothetical protein
LDLSISSIQEYDIVTIANYFPSFLPIYRVQAEQKAKRIEREEKLKAQKEQSKSKKAKSTSQKSKEEVAEKEGQKSKASAATTTKSGLPMMLPMDILESVAQMEGVDTQGSLMAGDKKRKHMRPEDFALMELEAELKAETQKRKKLEKTQKNVG